MSITRSLILGRLALPTVIDPVSETVGDAVTPDDSGVAVARRRPRQFTLQLPLYGIDSDMYSAGPRMRRQMRGMLENEVLRLAGLYFQWTVDTDMDGWLVPGGGQITDQDLGGITLGSWRLELDSALKIGSLRTHRPARRVELYDRVLSTTPRDYRGVILATDFASLRGTGSGPYLVTGQPTFVPVGAADALGQYRTPIVLNARAGIDGTGYFAVGLQHAQVAQFEQTEANMRKGDVVIWDRQGFTAPTFTLAGDTNPQDPTNGYGWEEVYGPDHALTANDCVAIANSLCRVRYVSATNSLAVDTYVAGTGFVEQGRITIWESTATDVWAQHVTPIAANSGAYGTVLEYTFDRAAIRLSTTGAHCRIDTMITLQRGWLGPRFETYCACFDGTTTTPGVQLRWTPNSAANQLESAAAAAQTFSGDGVGSIDPWAQSPGATYATLAEPWVYVQPVASSSTAVGVAIVSIQSLARSPSYTDNAAYGGGNRQSTAVAARFNETQVASQTVYGYVSMQLAFDLPGALGVIVANSFINAGGTRTSVASDTNAINANVVNDTQTSNAAATLSIASGTFGPIPLGRYGVWARVRATTSGDTGSIVATTPAGSTTAVTFTSTTYAWVYLGDVNHTANTDTLTLSLWRSAGVGTTGMRVDRVVLVPTERRATGNVTHDGARDVAGLALYDSQAIPTLVER